MTINEILRSDKTNDEKCLLLRQKLNKEVGEAFFFGQVKALYDEDKSPLEIAEQLKKPESAVRHYIQNLKEVYAMKEH